MFAIEFIEIAIIGGVVLGAVPPIPVAALGYENLFKSQFSLIFTHTRCCLGICLAGLSEVVPRLVVFRCADPYVEVGVDPRARYERLQVSKILMASDRFADRHRLD